MGRAFGRGERSAGGRTLEALLIFVAALVTTAVLMASVAGMLYLMLGLGH